MHTVACRGGCGDGGGPGHRISILRMASNQKIALMDIDEWGGGSSNLEVSKGVMPGIHKSLHATVCTAIVNANH